LRLIVLSSIFVTVSSQNYKIVFEQSSPEDLSKLVALTKCFHLFSYDDSKPKGLYLDSVLRFHAHHNNFLLIGSMSKILKN